MSARKRISWREKLADDNGLPKVIPITRKLGKRWGECTRAFPSTRGVEAPIHRVRKGKVASFRQARVSRGRGLQGMRLVHKAALEAVNRRRHLAWKPG